MSRFSKQTKTFIAVFLLSLCLSLLSCGSKEESSIPSATPAAGGIFNKFFPQKTGDSDIVFIQEKAGFAEAGLKRSGKEVACGFFGYIHRLFRAYRHSDIGSKAY